MKSIMPIVRISLFCLASTALLFSGAPASGALFDTPVLHNDSNGVWSFRESLTTGGTDFTAGHGGDVNFSITDIPVTGDWDGDGIDEIGILRAGGSTGTVWRWLLSGTNTGYADDPVSGFTVTDFIHGNTATDVPVIGDWDGDGVDSIGLVTDNGGTWRWRLTNTVSAAVDIAEFDHGTVSTDIPIAGDWDGDGDHTPGLIRDSGGDMRWLLTNNLGAGTEALDRTDGDFDTDLYAIGDWNIDGADSIGFYRPSTGEWFLPDTLTSPVTPAKLNFSVSGATQAFGVQTTIPEPASAALIALGVLGLITRRH